MEDKNKALIPYPPLQPSDNKPFVYTFSLHPDGPPQIMRPLSEQHDYGLESWIEKLNPPPIPARQINPDRSYLNMFATTYNAMRAMAYSNYGDEEHFIRDAMESCLRKKIISKEASLYTVWDELNIKIIDNELGVSYINPHKRLSYSMTEDEPQKWDFDFKYVVLPNGWKLSVIQTCNIDCPKIIKTKEVLGDVLINNDRNVANEIAGFVSPCEDCNDDNYGKFVILDNDNKIIKKLSYFSN